ncbi:MAG: hypothetical protein JST92_21895, partial [Deltaproteobacteria bacterium]|nr:hypothetical protein [Deltaproteobacteria bacterium]
MSESAVQVQSGPSLEQILWGAVERWSQTDVPSVTDREEFAARITEAWGGDTPTEEFLAHFFGEDRSPSAGDAADMAEAIVKATRDRMFVYEFDLNHLEYVVVEGDDDVMTVVGDMGQFQFNVDDTVRSLVEAAIIPDSYNPVGSGGEYDRNKNQGQPKAYLLRSTGEMVAVNVQAITRAIALGASLRQVEAPMVDRPALNLAPFAPRKTRVLTAEREARILRQDARLRSTSQADFIGTKSRDRIMSLAGLGGSSAAAAALSPPPMSAETTVFLLMPDGTLAQPVIGSATRWREMVSDWTARAAFISMGGTTAPVAVASGEQRFVVQGASVVAMFTGGQSNQASASAPGAVGFAAEASGIGVMAARSQIAPIRVLSDEDLARAVAGGAQLVSGLTANIVQADGHTSVGFWMQPEALFAPSTQDMQLVQGTTTPSAPATSGSGELDQLLADINGGNPAQLGQVTGDPWADWALQAGGKINPGELLLAARNRPQASPGSYGGAVSADGSDLPAGPRVGPGGTLHFPGSKLMAFRAPDGSVISARAGGFPVRLAQAGRSLEGLGLAPDFAQAGGMRGQIPLAARSGALPATALAALSMALERTANAAGYKLPFVRIESASNAIGDGDQIALSLPADHPLRSEARLMGSPLIDGQTTRLVLSMPFPNSGEVHVGSDLSDAL